MTKIVSRLNRQELSGSLGDLGTFIPLLVGLSVTCGINFASALFFAGFFNVATGLIFSIPMAVQPMKAIAAIAINQELPTEQILAAGIISGGVVFLLGVTRLIDVFNRIIPLAVVRGLQLGLGLILIGKGINLVQSTQTWIALDSMTMGITGFALALAFAGSSRIPIALILFLFGLAVAYINHPATLSDLSLGLYLPSFNPLYTEDFRQGFFSMAIPQIPLTTLNSVIAVCALSMDLFPRTPAKPRPVSISVGMMNLVGCWFGAMPMCHGAGGLAGQYRFGARSNASIIFLGVMKMLLALFLGGSLLAMLQVFPVSVLGVLLGVSGLELASAARDQNERDPAMIMIATAGATIALRSTALGFAMGWTLALLLEYSGRRRKAGG